MRRVLVGYFFLFPIIVIAKNNEVEKKYSSKYKFEIYLGIGVTSIVKTYLRNIKTDFTKNVKGNGPFLLKSECFFNNKISIVANFSYSDYKLTISGDSARDINSVYKNFNTIIQAQDFSYLLRCNYHFIKKMHKDLFLGIGIGNSALQFNDYQEPNVNGGIGFYNPPRTLALEFTVGYKYFFTKKFGLYSELGIGKLWVLELFGKTHFVPDALLQIGVTYKIN